MKKRLLMSTGSKDSFIKNIRQYYFVSPKESIRLNKSGTVSRTINGKWKVYNDITWEIKKGRYRLVY